MTCIDEFSDRLKELYASDPARVRFVLKYKHAEGTMTMRATNDEIWLIHKTDQAAEMRRLEALQQWIMAAMCGADADALVAADAAAAEEAESARRESAGGKRKHKKRGK